MTQDDLARLMNSAPSELRGSVTPRLWTPPLRELTPETSWGFDFNDFCRDVAGEPNDEWQEWLSIHVGEELPDGRPRFRTVLVLVARQQGKTSWARKLIQYWLFVDKVSMVLATSTNRQYAKAEWTKNKDLILDNEWFHDELANSPERLTIGEEALKTKWGEYKFAASNRRAGRSMTLPRALLDEIREHVDFSAWNAVSKAMNAVRTAQLVAISNQGDAGAVVLDSLRLPAIKYIETGHGDPRLGLFEYSAPDGADPTDLAALAMANPDLGNRTDPEVLLADARRAVEAGGEELAGFRTEVMCQRVHLLDPAIDPDEWTTSGTDQPVDLAAYRRQTALCFDVSLDGLHAALIAAAKIDDTTHVEVVEAWEGRGCTKQLRADLPGIVGKVKPRVLGWFPAGPAASVAADLADRGHRQWPPRGVRVEDIKGETTQVCMGLQEIITAGDLQHPNDPMLTGHINATTKLWRGDAWVFARKGATPISGSYALAGAVHLARTLPPAPAPVTVL